MKDSDEHSIYIDTSDGIGQRCKVWWGAELTLKRSGFRIRGR